jgi:hypothetical protein
MVTFFDISGLLLELIEKITGMRCALETVGILISTR